MMSLVVKVAITAILVAAISELGKRSTTAGALLAALPLTSLLALVWLYRDTGDALRAATLASEIFWLVLPSLAFFWVFPLAIRHGWTFWSAMGGGIGSTLVAYGALLGADRVFTLKLFG